MTIAAGTARRTRSGAVGRSSSPRSAARRRPPLALAYVLNQPVRVLAAVGTRSEAHLDELLDAATFPLDAEDVSWLSGPGER